MSQIVKYNPQSASLRRLEQTLERERQSTPLPQTRTNGPIARRTTKLPPRVDLLRVCAQHENPYAAVYLLDSGNGGYHYSTSVAISKTLYRTQYAPAVAETVIWDNKWIDEETCALCGVSGRPVQCGVCRQISCRGRSTGQYFRCSCKAEGWIEERAFEHIGVIPSMAP